MIVATTLAPRLNHPKWRDDYNVALVWQNQSCFKFDVDQFLLTDDPEWEPSFKRFGMVLPEPLMPALISAQLQFLQSGVQEDIIFAGADCILGRDPRGVFDDAKFDVAFTTHPFSDCILNTGAIFVPAGKAAVVEGFWAAALARCGERWGDDQLALASVVVPTLEHGLYQRHGRSVQFFPCAGYNWAPEGPHDDAGMPYVVHFRGPRKAWLPQWCDQWLV